ncbi:hypothetical protein SynPROS71_02023 [Synechococcus sp. PROS-7-1]|uniref:hypothetical protein n=1 Tax=Synechococcus sp. PROS-7-1 TaxID=1442556 RepID=UPI0016470793|nr:hypothetical protein [Synechococcus sp. PROS-7-1]QNI85799.1 hypothetical protein SynPROS71_02023 [Synechococcus sp. PROS-7-1]
MFELEFLLAMGVGAALVAVAPAVKAVSGKETDWSRSVSNSGRTITKQGLKLGIRLADTTGALLKGVGHGFSEVSETFTDLLAEARADLETNKPTQPAVTVTSKRG